MGHKLLSVIFFFSLVGVYGQTVSVSTNQSPGQYANELLNSNCANVSNANVSSSKAVGTFDSNGGKFPFKNGVIIRSGNADFSEGKYTGNNLDSELNTDSDQALLDLITATGQEATINEIGYLEFEFIAYNDDFNFNFIFASNEYGPNQCTAADAMGAFLTDLTAAGQPKNIAYLGNPSTPVPISINNIHDATGCEPANAQFFSTYNVDFPANSTLNMNGYTVPLTASVKTIPGHRYKIRLIVGDAEDTNRDSAILLEGGSFNTGIDLGPDQGLCETEGETATFNTGLDASIFRHTWTRDGNVIPGETGSTISVSQKGTYKVSVQENGSSCTVSDEVKVSTFALKKNVDPLNLCFQEKGYTIDLTDKVPEIVGNQDPAKLDISFYTSNADAETRANAIQNPEKYKLPANFPSQPIYVRVDNSGGCGEIADFTIKELPVPKVDTHGDVQVCSTYTLPALNNGNYYTKRNGKGTKLNPDDAITESGTYYIFAKSSNGCSQETSFKVTVIQDYADKLDDLKESCGDFTVPNPPAGAFYDQSGGAGNKIPAGTTYSNDVTLYYYAENNGASCVDKRLDIKVNPKPMVGNLADITTCGSYTLPTLNDGNYFTRAGGNGTQLNAGAKITSSQKIYIFSDDGTCTNQSSFQVNIIPAFQEVPPFCGVYTLPRVRGVEKYQDGSGNGFNPGDTLTNTGETIKTFNITAIAPEASNCSSNALSFKVRLKPLAKVDSLPDREFICEPTFYTLPPLTNGQYFTGPNRTGNQLPEGKRLAKTDTIYINNKGDLEFCPNESSFTITFYPLPPIPNFRDVNSCGPYVLPTPFAGDYYTEKNGPAGTGTPLSPGDTIKKTQTIYIYRSIDNIADCVSEDEFKVSVKNTVQEMADVKACDSYTLPDLKIGKYYRTSGGLGTSVPAGTTITKTDTLYVYDNSKTPFLCENEERFIVNISKTPSIANGTFPDVKSCGDFRLPDSLSTATDSVSYSLSPGGKPIPFAEYTISKPGDYTIYVKKEARSNPDCFVTDSFNLTVFPLRTFTVQPATICKDPETGVVLSEAYLDSGIDPAGYKIEWFLNGQVVHEGPDFNAKEPGEYTVKTTKLATMPPDMETDCNYVPATVKVGVSGKPTIETEVTQDFEEIANIKVTVVKGIGDYVFRLDARPFQNKNVFTDVSSGLHTITVKGAVGSCGETVVQVQVVKYPKFFTPNADGYNDRWNIKDLADHPEAKINIFDRYGKLLTQIYPNGSGWDGTYNGHPMPSNDYWFNVLYESEGEPQHFKSHFTLKR